MRTGRSAFRLVVLTAGLWGVFTVVQLILAASKTGARHEVENPVLLLSCWALVTIYAGFVAYYTRFRFRTERSLTVAGAGLLGLASIFLVQVLYFVINF